MSLSIICAHRWGAPIPTSIQNDKGELTPATLRYCPGCTTTWRTDKPEPRVVTGFLEDLKEVAPSKKED
jgi:hypothetical protein